MRKAMAERYESEEQETELRSKLMKRLAVAGVMVALLLGVLAFFDYLAKAPEPSPKVFTEPVPVPPKKEVTQPVTPNIELAEPPKTDAAAPVADKEGTPPAPPVEAPPKPEVAAEPAPPVADGKVAGKILPQRPAPVREAPAPAAPSRAVPESTGAPVTPATPAPPPAAAAVQPQQHPAPPVAVAQPVITTPPPLARLLPGYVVQAGVFTNARAAEELHAKLALNGIPSNLEARVQVGPFKTRAEAEAARAKMKALGIGGILIPPAPAKR